MMFWNRTQTTVDTSIEEESTDHEFKNLALEPIGNVSSASSYILSDARREQLLQAAQANRISWVDGLSSTKSTEYVTSFINTKEKTSETLPPPCIEAFENISKDLKSLIHSIELLKHQVIPQFTNASNLVPTRTKQDTNSMQYLSIIQEIEAHSKQLLDWKNTYKETKSLSNSPMTIKTYQSDMQFMCAFQEFLMLLKHPKSANLVYKIQSFVNKFNSKSLVHSNGSNQYKEVSSRRGYIVQKFIATIILNIRQQKQVCDRCKELQFEFLRLHELKTKGHSKNNDQILDLLHEVFEAFLMEKLYRTALTPSKDAEERDLALHERIQSLNFVTFHHLDLQSPLEDDVQTQDRWNNLIQQFKNITAHMSPRRKMDSILRICQDLTSFLKETSVRAILPSADEFLPALIYVILKANPIELQRSLDYIMEYRNPKKLASEPGYFLTHVVSSVAFLENVHKGMLSITADEFENGLRQSKEKIVQDVELKRKEKIPMKQNENEDNMELGEPHLIDVLEVRARRLKQERLLLQ